MVVGEQFELRSQSPPSRSDLGIVRYIRATGCKCATALSVSGKGVRTWRFQTHLHLDMVHQAYQGVR